MIAYRRKRKKIYCFDTSAFLALSRTHEKVIKIDNAIWDQLEKLMQEGLLISHQIVFDEIMSGTKNPPQIVKWIGKVKKHFLPKTDAQKIQVPEIVRQFPDLIEVGREKEQADPWLIALALEKCKEATLFDVQLCIVVTQENANSSRKIPAACKKFKLKHMSLREFFDDIGLSTKLSKK